MYFFPAVIANFFRKVILWNTCKRILVYEPNTAYKWNAWRHRYLPAVAITNYCFSFDMIKIIANFLAVTIIVLVDSQHIDICDNSNTWLSIFNCGGRVKMIYILYGNGFCGSFQCIEVVVRRCFVKKVFLKILQISQEQMSESFFNKVAGSPATLSKKRLWHSRFLVSLRNF